MVVNVRMACAASVETFSTKRSRLRKKNTVSTLSLQVSNFWLISRPLNATYLQYILVDGDLI